MKFLLIFFSTLAFAAEPSVTEVRVRMKHSEPMIEVSGEGLQISPPSAFFEVEPHAGTHRARITHRADGQWLIQWDKNRKPEKIRSERLWVRGETIHLGAIPTPYNLEILEATKSGLDVIARLDLDTYLMGVLPAEMPISWPIEALKAQVVAARSFALREMSERKEKDFDLDSTVVDQAYRFMDFDEESPSLIEKIRKAVASTRGEVLVDKRSKIIKAFYSADCGCQSEDPKFVWGRVEAFESVKDPTCKNRRPTLWKVNLDREEVRSKLLKALSLPAVAELRTIQVAGRTPSGRVAEVVAAMEVNGQVKNMSLSAQEFRKIFGFQKVQSADFSTHWMAKELEISGTGSGHGVGLCQRGAHSLANTGLDYRSILKVYYPRARVNTLKSI